MSIFYYNKVLNDSALLSEDRLAVVYNNLGGIYKKKRDFNKALLFINKGLQINLRNKNNKGICISYINLAEINWRKNDLIEAKKFGLKGFELANKLGFPNAIMSSAASLGDIEAGFGNWREAYKYMYIFHNMKDSINSLENAKAAIKEQELNKYEKQKAVDDALSAKEIQLMSERENKQKLISILIAIGLLLTVVFSFFIVSRLRLTNRQKRIIEEQKHLVEDKNKIIEHKQKEVMDSIRYAQRIQKAHLPSDGFISRVLKEAQKKS
jgi:hypothetical protein